MITALVIIGALVAVVFAWFATEVRLAARAPVTPDDVNAAADMWTRPPAPFRDDCGCRVRLRADGHPYLAPCPAHEAIAEVEASREAM